MEDGSSAVNAWVVSQCTAGLSKAQVANGNSTLTSPAEAHALKLLATQRGNVRSSKLRLTAEEDLALHSFKFPAKGS